MEELLCGAFVLFTLIVMVVPKSLPGVKGASKRCPNCDLRISLCARVCPFCGTRFDRDRDVVDFLFFKNIKSIVGIGFIFLILYTVVLFVQYA